MLHGRFLSQRCQSLQCQSQCDPGRYDITAGTSPSSPTRHTDAPAVTAPPAPGSAYAAAHTDSGRPSTNDTFDCSTQTLQPTAVLPDHRHKTYLCCDRRLRLAPQSTPAVGWTICSDHTTQPPSSSALSQWRPLSSSTLSQCCMTNIGQDITAGTSPSSPARHTVAPAVTASPAPAQPRPRRTPTRADNPRTTPSQPPFTNGN